MKRTIAFLGFLTLIVTLGCAHWAPPVRLEGRPGDLEALIGQWTGTYVSDGIFGRHGTISFKLAAGEGQAFGSVLMIPAGDRRPYQRYQWGDPRRPGWPGWSFPPARELLTIRFVRVEDGFLNGVLDPYWDPDRQSRAWTTFRGRLGQHTIDGTFRSTYEEPYATTTGQWWVTRD